MGRIAAIAQAPDTRSGEGVDLGGKLEIGGGEPTLRVRGDRHRHRVPGDLDVRVVSHRLCRLDQATNELNRADEIASIKAAGDRISPALPATQAGKPFLDLGIAQKRHRAIITEFASAPITLIR